jgi:hypothetical protein
LLEISRSALAVVVVTGSGFVFLPPVPFTTSHSPEVCLFDSSTAQTREAGDVE